MAIKSHIEWTEATWNPVTGCTKVSLGCQNCYAERLARRLRAMGNPNYVNGFRVTRHEHMLELPYRWREPRLVFVNSMSDVFHERVPLEFIRRMFDVMGDTRRHTYQVLTKRSERMLELADELPWPANVWMGVTVEHPDYAFRVNHLRDTPASTKFLSLEPLLAPIPRLDLSGIDWVIVGGESGPGARPMERKWVLQVRDRCREAGVSFFFKQWGGRNKKKNGRLLDGETYDAMPVAAEQGGLFSEVG